MKITIRILHRYIGFFLVGIMSIYAFSGIVLTYRDTTIFKIEKEFIKELEPNISPKDLGKHIRMRRFNVEEVTKEHIIFNAGSYNKITGIAQYKQMVYPTIINKMISLHLTPSGKPMFWLTTTFGISLLFMAISSFWMFKPKTKIFKRGIVVIGLGILFTVVLIMI